VHVLQEASIAFYYRQVFHRDVLTVTGQSRYSTPLLNLSSFEAYKREKKFLRMSALLLYVLRPLLHGLRQFSPPPHYSAELKQTKPLSPRFATSLLYRRRLCRSSSKTFPRFWQLYGFLISILGSPPPGQALEADPPTPPLGLPPRGLPPGAPLRIVCYVVSYRI
jgi:hypothetical protein